MKSSIILLLAVLMVLPVSSCKRKPGQGEAPLSAEPATDGGRSEDSGTFVVPPDEGAPPEGPPRMILIPCPPAKCQKGHLCVKLSSGLGSCIGLDGASCPPPSKNPKDDSTDQSCQEKPPGRRVDVGGLLKCIPSRPGNTNADCARFRSELLCKAVTIALRNCAFRNQVRCITRSCKVPCRLTVRGEGAGPVLLHKNDGGCRKNEDACRVASARFDCECECLRK